MTQSERVAAWVVDGPVFWPLMSRFTAPQRQLVRSSMIRNFSSYRIIAIFAVGIFLAPLLFSPSRFCHCASHAEAVWLSFLAGFGPTGASPAFVAFFAALTLAALYLPANWHFYGTRPVSRHFLFWSQYLMGAVAVLMSIAFILAASVLLLTAIYGWRPAVGAYAMAGPISIPKEALSLLTSTLLVYSLLVPMSLVPQFRILLVPVALLSGVLLSVQSFPLLGFKDHSNLLFLYLNPVSVHCPPVYAEAFVPVVLSFLLASLAERLLARCET